MADSDAVAVTPELLKQVGQFGQLQFAPAGVEILCDLPDGALAESPALHRAYLKGLLSMQAVVRQDLVKRCREGDNSAIKVFQGLADAVGVEYEE